MNRITVLLVALTVGGMTTLPAQAQSLADALEQAWSRHPLASASAARTTEAQARTEVASGLTPGPASVSLSSLNDRLNANRGRQEWEVEMAVPLWLPGQRAARQAEASAAQNELDARQRALRLQVAGEVRDAWWAIAAARNASDLADRRVATARDLALDVTRRFKVGELARVDANLAQNENLIAQTELAEAQTALLQAEQAYRGLTGVAAPVVLLAETHVATQSLDQEHPQLVASAAAVQLAEARLKAVDETRRDAPTLAVRMVRDRADSIEPFGNTVGIKLTVPFSSGARVRQENSAARAELAQADAELAIAQTRLQLGTEKARRELDTAQRQLALAGQRHELTADNLRLAEKSFSLGESDLSNLLRVRAAAFEAQAFLSRQQVTLAASQSRINQIMGVLP
jgi:cobalt-zinc-cadmium efflux system outer membrane protein